MVKELIEKRLRLHEQAQAVLNKAKDAKRETVSADELAEFDAIHAEMDALKATIDRMERSEAVERELAESRGRKTEPNTPVPEIRHAEHGQPAPASRFIETTEEDRLEGFRAWFMAGSDLRTKITPQQAEIARRVGFDLSVRQVDVRLSRSPLKRVSDAEKWTQYRAQGVGTGPAGLFAVPDETMRALEVALLTFGGMRQASTVFRTDRGADLPIPTVNDTTQAGVLLGENSTVATQDVVFSQIVLQAFKYSSKMILVSVELLQDNVINLAQFLGEALGTRIGRITNTHFTTGTGSGQPNGVVTASTNGKTGSTGQTTSVIYDDLVDLEHSVDPAYRIGARWMMHDSSLKVVKKLKDTTGRPLWLPGMAVNAPDTILGYPFVINQDVAVMAASAKSILFGDFGKYLIRDTAEISLLRLDERFADFHQVAFLAFSRHDGDLLNAGTNPVKFYTNSAT